MYKSLILFAFVLISCRTTQHISSTEVAYVSTEDQTVIDNGVEAMISPYRSQLSEKMNVVLGELDQDLVKGKPNSNLGSWFTDILHAEAEAIFDTEIDLAVQNYGGLRIPSVPAGPLTVNKIYELMPFDNTLVLLDIPGVTLKLFLDGIAASGGWPVSHTLSMTIIDEQATDIMIRDQALDPKKTYKIAIPDYVARGGDKNDFLKGVPLTDSGLFIREVVIDHLNALQENGLPITVNNSKRIKVKR